MNFEKLREILETEAKSEGLEHYEIYYTSSEGLNAETLEHEISSFSSGVSAGVSFRCVWQGSMGNAATELFEENELRSLVRRAKANAEVIENGEQAIIFGGSEKYATVAESVAQMPQVSDIKKLALSIEKQIYGESELVTEGTQSGVFAESSRVELANSKGLRLSNKLFVAGAYAQAVVNREGEAQEAFDFAMGLDKTDALASKSVSDAIAKLGASEIPSGKYNIILDGKQMRAMLSAFSGVFSGKNAMLGLSLLAGKEGQKIAADCVCITDDPMREGAPMQTHFDGEGVATYKKDIVKDGVLTTLLYDLTTAAKAGVASTGNGMRGSYASQVNVAPFNFSLCPGTLTEDELIAKAENGIYVTAVKGLHAGADATTGDFSIESEGFLIENGKKTTYVRSFTIAGNFFELLKNIDSLSDTVEWGIPGGFTVFGAPAALIKDMSVAGK